ncbi:MAG: hypothetical protein K2I20_00870 [Clostridia bacterium]|nr:hypothetical protein [Clostridia bacterium]MDE7214672.1 hypothetical protein [Clostridia bacterium]
MKKNLKLLVIGLLVAVAATLTCAFMPACGDGATTYSVKVTCAEEGFDYTQITAQWCLVSADKTETIQCYGLPVRLNADGEATCTADLPALEGGQSFHVQLNNVPKGYSYGSEQYATGFGTVTYTLTKTN